MAYLLACLIIWPFHFLPWLDNKDILIALINKIIFYDQPIRYFRVYCPKNQWIINGWLAISSVENIILKKKKFTHIWKTFIIFIWGQNLNIFCWVIFSGSSKYYIVWWKLEYSKNLTDWRTHSKAIHQNFGYVIYW